MVIPKSKIDQAGIGERVPMSRMVPVIGDIKIYIEQLKQIYYDMGWSTDSSFVMAMYNA